MVKRGLKNSYGASGLSHAYNFTFISSLFLLLIAFIPVSQLNDIYKRALKV